MAVSAPLRTLFDASARWFVKQHSGQVGILENIVVLLIYQPSGISNSTFHTLNHLVKQGFSPVVVVNHRIRPTQLKALKNAAMTVIERPNYGYDFGGYRQGILHVLSLGLEPKKLLILNDSIWFPLKANCSFLEEVKTNGADVYGLVMNDLSEDKSRHHIQSYFICFTERLIKSDSFKTYWQKLFLSNNKLAVIRLCEIRMTEHFRRLGFTADAKFRVNDLYEAMNSISDSELKKIIKYQKSVDPRKKRIIEAAEHDRNKKRSLTEKKLLGRYFLIAHPLLLIGKLDCPTMKKDKQLSYQIQRATLFDESLHHGISDVVLGEMRRSAFRGPLSS